MIALSLILIALLLIVGILFLAGYAADGDLMTWVLATNLMAHLIEALFAIVAAILDNVSGR